MLRSMQHDKIVNTFSFLVTCKRYMQSSVYLFWDPPLEGIASEFHEQILKKLHFSSQRYINVDLADLHKNAVVSQKMGTLSPQQHVNIAASPNDFSSEGEGFKTNMYSSAKTLQVRQSLSGALMSPAISFKPEGGSLLTGLGLSTVGSNQTMQPPTTAPQRLPSVSGSAKRRSVSGEKKPTTKTKKKMLGRQNAVSEAAGQFSQQLNAKSSVEMTDEERKDLEEEITRARLYNKTNATNVSLKRPRIDGL